MSDAAHSTVSEDSQLFTPVEVEEFASDDVKAGSAIGIMLSALFLYTIVAMAISSWWTASSIKEASATPAPASEDAEH
ncbi:MAG: hypothetical protein ACK58L_20820 [Planctomycetota bacterium]